MMRITSIVSALGAAAILGLATASAHASAQDMTDSAALGVAKTPPSIMSLLAIANLSGKSGAALDVMSPAFANGGDIPFENTQYRGNVFPGLSWTPGPAGVRSYVVIMQDPDSVYRGAPILHWTMFNIPASVTRLDAAMSAPPAGASAGPNIRGPSQPYMGPRTPPGPKHHYHIQVFALDTALPPEAAGGYDALTTAMKDHVLASGELIGLGHADPAAPPRTPPPVHF